jgi:hypothetical protein
MWLAHGGQTCDSSVIPLEIWRSPVVGMAVVARRLCAAEESLI